MAITIDKGHDIPTYSNVCSLCKNLDDEVRRACMAFPQEESIPMAIWLGENDHRKPVSGDHGIRFEPVDQ